MTKPVNWFWLRLLGDIGRFFKGLLENQYRIIAPTYHKRCKQHDESIGIPRNYLQLAQSAGKNHAHKVRLILKNWRDSFKEITSVITFDSHLRKIAPMAVFIAMLELKKIK